MSNRIALNAIAIVLACSAFSASAAAINWTGAGGNTNWSQAGNWDLNRAPGVGDDVVLTGAGAFRPLTQDIAGLSINSLSFDSSASTSITVAGGNSITLTSATTPQVFVDPASADHTISDNIVLNGNQPWSIGAGRTLTVSGVISGGLGLTLSGGTGTLLLTNANVYTGGTTINSGTLRFGANSAINSGTNVFVNSPGTLNVASFNCSLNALTLSGGTVSGTTGVIALTSNLQTPSALTTFASSTTAVISASVQLINGGQFFTVGLGTAPGGVDLRIDGIVDSNNFSFFRKTGPGVLALTGANTCVSPDLLGGTLALGNDQAMGNQGGFLPIYDPGNVGQLNPTYPGVPNIITAFNGAHTVAIPITIEDASTALTFAGTDDLIVQSPITEAATCSIIKNGTGVATLTGANGYSGTTTINAGTLQIGNGGGAGNIGSGSIINNAALVFNLNTTVNLGNSVSGSGSLSQNGSGTLILSGANTYSGVTNFNAGVVQINGNSNIGNGSATNTIGFNGGTLESTGNSYDLTTNRAITLNGPGTIQTDSGTLTVSGNVTNGVNLLTVSGAGNTTISGTIGGGTGGLTKSGAGTLTLNATNTFTGATTVSAGALIGTGSVGGALVVTGGNVSPGLAASKGAFGANSSANFSAGGTLTIRIGGYATAGSDFDQLNLNGSLTSGGLSTLVLDVNGLKTSGTATGIVTYTSSVAQFTTVSLINNTGGFTASLSYTGTRLNCTINPGPFTKLQILLPGEVAAPGTPTGKTAASPTAQTYGTPFIVTVNSVDNNFNVVTTAPSDTIAITSTDGTAVLPASANLSSGTQTFSIALKTVTNTNTITATDSSNGGIASSTSPAVTVNARPVTLSGTRPYDGSTSAAATILSITNNLDGANLTLGGSATLASANGGTEPITVFTSLSLGGSAANNYTLSSGASGSVAISKVALTVTADPSTRAYGATDPAFTATITGFVNSETLATSDVTGSPAFSDNATSNSAPGLYTITPAVGSLTSGNYSFTFVNGVLTVSKANTSVTLASSANPASITAPVTITATISSVATPTGSVTFTVDGLAQAPMALAGNTAAFSSSTLSIGNHTFAAAYSGDANFTASASTTLTQAIIETTPPTVLSPPSASTTSGTVGVPVTFAFGVSDPSPVTYTWDFGDGSVVTTSSTSIVHTYTSPGVYTVTGTATNAGGQSVTGSVTFSVAAPATAPGTLCSGLNPIALKVQTVTAKLFFGGKVVNKDSLSLKSVIALPNNFVAAGQQVQWSIGNIQGTTKLDSKGNGLKSTTTKVTLKFKTKKGKFVGGNGTLMIQLKSQTLTNLLLAGVPVLNINNQNKKGDPARMDICVVLTGLQAYEQDGVLGVYKSKLNKTATFTAKFK